MNQSGQSSKQATSDGLGKSLAVGDSLGEADGPAALGLGLAEGNPFGDSFDGEVIEFEGL